jgi:hypothetical protein
MSAEPSPPSEPGEGEEQEPSSENEREPVERVVERDKDEAPPDAKSDVEDSRRAPWWDAGGTGLTWAYWGSLAVLVASLWRSLLLPFVDYPQHLALAAILRRMLSPSAPERQLFETNLVSYNSLFHVLVAGLNVVLPIHDAGKVVLAGYVVLVGASTLVILRATGRPRARAFLVVPVVIGYSIIWGFVNFGLGLAIQMLVLARVLERTIDWPAPSPLVPSALSIPPPPKKERWWRTTWGRDAITAAIAVAGAWAHLLGSALMYMLMLVAIVVRVQTSRAPLLQRVGRAMRVGAPLLPAILYCYLVYRHQESGYRNYEYGAYEGNDTFGMVKVKEFFTYATGFRADGLDAKVLSIGIGLLVIGALLRDPEDEAPPVARWLFVSALLAYLVIPHVFWATNFVFERITFIVVLGAIVWAPRARPKFEAPLRLMFASVGIAAAASFWNAMGSVKQETSDLEAILEGAPKNRRVMGLVWDPRLPSTLQWSMLHSPAFYVAQNGGEVAFSFTRHMSLPVHYKASTMPPDLPANFEWNPGDYRPGSPYAQYFDLVLMKTTNDDGVDPRSSVWGLYASQVDLVAHKGKWWLFETKRVSVDSIDDPRKGFELPFMPDDDGTGDNGDDVPDDSPSAP